MRTDKNRASIPISILLIIVLSVTLFSCATKSIQLEDKRVTTSESIFCENDFKNISVDFSQRGDLQNITLELDRNKGLIYGVYNRALKGNSNLEGKVTITIQTGVGGIVEKVCVSSSEIDDKVFLKELIDTIKTHCVFSRNEFIVFPYPMDFVNN